MKKVILITFILILVGCSNGGNLDKYPLQSPENSSGLDISLPNRNFEKADSLKLFGPQYTADKDDKYHDDITGWSEYFREKHGLNINIGYGGPQSLKKAISNGSIIYLNYQRNFYAGFNFDIFRYAEPAFYGRPAVSAHNLKKYYNLYDWEDYVDKKYVDMLSVNGDIYSIPVVGDEYVIPRYYNKQYLEAVNMKVPNTIDEFHEYLKATKRLNGNNNSYYPMYVDVHKLTQSTSDIFRAFNVYFNSASNTSVGYNPKTNSFEDGVFSEDIYSALEFIHLLQQENLLKIFSTDSTIYHDKDGNINYLFKDYPDSVDTNTATEYTYIFQQSPYMGRWYKYYKPSYETVKGYYLEGFNTEKLMEVRKDLAFYIFPDTIKNIDGTIELFDEVFTNQNLYYDLRYGIQGSDYKIKNDTLVINKEVHDGFVDLKLLNRVIEPTELPLHNIIDRVPDRVKYERNSFQYLRTLTQSFGGIIDQNDFKLLFNPDISVEDAIENYKTYFKKNAIKDILDKVNDKLGTKTVFDYN